MAILDKHLELVKSQVAFHLGRAEEYANSPKRQQKHLQTAKQFQELLEALLEVVKQPQAATLTDASGGGRSSTGASPPEPRLTLTREELADLPEEVLSELSTSGTDPVGYAILDLLERRGMMSLDQIIVALYREFGEVHKRQNVNSRMYRMAQKGLIKPVEGKRGVYALNEAGAADDDMPAQTSFLGGPNIETYFAHPGPRGAPGPTGAKG